MIYLKNNTEKQTIFIPRNELQKEAYITTIRTYEDGLKDGYGNGIEHQKDQLLNLYVTENGVYEREDGYGIVTVEMEGGCNLETPPMITYQNNGVYTITPSEGYDGLEKVVVDVWVSKEANLQRKTVEMDERATLLVRPDNGYDGMKTVNINAVKLAQRNYDMGYEDGKNNANLEDREENYTQNGSYLMFPNEGYDGMRSFLVNIDVPQEGGSCNLEDKIIAPQTNEVDGYGYIYIRPNEGYDGILEVALQTDNLKKEWRNEGYEEGYEEGKSQGGNIQADKSLQPQLSEIEEGWLYVYPDEGYIGMSRTTIQTANLREGWYNEGYEQGKAEGGNCNLSHQLEVIGRNGRHLFYPQNNGWDGYDLFEVEVEVPTTAKLQDVWVTPSMADRDDNNLLVYSPNTDEGYDGLSRVVIDPQTIYNEGYEQGKAEGNGVVYNKLSAEFELYSFYALKPLDSNALVNQDGNKTQHIITSERGISYIWSNADKEKCVFTIKENAFSNLTSIRKAKLYTITTISERAFKNATSLEEIEYDFSGVGFVSGYFNTIKDEAFSGCSKLSKIIWRLSNPDFEGDNIFNGLPENGTLYLGENMDENVWLERLPNGWRVERL